MNTNDLISNFESKPLIAKGLILSQAERYRQLAKEKESYLPYETIKKSVSWLGQIVDEIYIKDYVIVEYKEKDITSKEITNRSLFYLFVQGKSTNTSYSSFDAALAAGIAIKYEGRDYAATYFMKMIGANSDQK